MARSTSSNPNKPRTSSSGTSRQTPSSGAPTLEPWWKRAALAVPRALGAGVVMNIVYRLIRFEPRDIKHRDVIEVVRELKS